MMIQMWLYIREKERWKNPKNDQIHKIKITIATTTTFFVYFSILSFIKVFHVLNPLNLTTNLFWQYPVLQQQWKTGKVVHKGRRMANYQFELGPTQSQRSQYQSLKTERLSQCQSLSIILRKFKYKFILILGSI